MRRWNVTACRASLPLVLISSLLVPAAAQAGPGRARSAAPSPGREVSPELPVAVYRARRERLMKHLGPCAAAIRSTPAPDEDGTAFDPYFFYLTGIRESDALLLLSPRQLTRQILFLAPLDPEAEIWTGYREPLSPELRRTYGVDEVRRAHGSGSAAYMLGRALRQSRCYAELRAAFAGRPTFDQAMLAKYMSALQARTEQRWEVLEHMRAVKDTEELARMEKAIAITFAGHRAAMQSLRPGVTERQLASRIDDAFFANGATAVAFPSIVGSGPNGAILHWARRDRVMADGDLVVIDIGASYGGYAADITRTYPLSGTFTAEQRTVYDAVLTAQNKVIAAVRPGISLARLNKLGQQAIAEHGYELPHSIGHFVGLEVHDVGDQDAPLEAGMVITVEPGIYIKGKLGVRIEDMVLVTPQGHRLLSSAMPRDAAAIEAMMKEAARAE